MSDFTVEVAGSNNNWSSCTTHYLSESLSEENTQTSVEWDYNQEIEITHTTNILILTYNAGTGTTLHLFNFVCIL